MRITEFTERTPKVGDFIVTDGADGVHKSKVGDILSVSNVSGVINLHNSIYRGKDITEYFQDGTLWQRLHGTNGFAVCEDLWLGDYWNTGVAITCQGSYQGERGGTYHEILGFNSLEGNGDSAIAVPHMVVTVGGAGNKQHFGRHAMNSSNTTAGGYSGSVMHTEIYGAIASAGKTYENGGTINEQLYAVYGSHLKTSRELLSNGINSTGYNRFGTNSGCSNGFAWANAQACNMSEVEVYGSIVWSSSAYDTGSAKVQLPAFRYSTKDINNRTAYYWLKDVASASYFCGVGDRSTAGHHDASDADIWVRPRFVLL